MKTIIFTDGGSKDNPGPGGWGAILIAGERVLEIGGGEEKTTNNRMELRAVIEGINKSQSYSITVYTDSSYLVNGITKWAKGWQENNWMNSQKKPVSNQDLWESLIKAVEGKEIEWNVVGGHVKVSGNERADKIVSAFRENRNIDLYEGDLKSYPVKDIKNISPDKLAQAEKTKKRERSKAKAYSYVSLVGSEVQTHQAWAECERRVKGKPNVKFRKSLSKEDEINIIEEFKRVQ